MTAGESPKNVLLITVDSLRYDFWESLKPSLDTGPALEADGTSFSRAFATGPGTSPSFPAMLCGTLPLSYGGLGPLLESRPRVASQLRERGYATGGFHSNPFLSRHFDYEVGFDEFEDYQNPLMGVAMRVFPRGIELNNPVLERVDDLVNMTGLIKTAYHRFRGKPRPYVAAEVITDDAIKWLGRTQGPFFGWVHYMDVHHPCHPPSEDRAAFGVEDIDSETVSDLYSTMINDPDSLTDRQTAILENLYKAAIRYVDRQIGRLVTELKEQGRYEDTLLILTSDHGELFGDHDQYGKPERMYDELLRVPLVIANTPDSMALTGEELVSLLDLPPLWHEMLGEEIPPAYEGIVPGRQTREYVLAEHEVGGAPIVGVRSDNWRYEIDQIREETRFVDLSTRQQVDPATANLGSEAQTVISAAEERIEQLDGPARSAPEPQLNDDVKARLEDLGYR